MKVKAQKINTLIAQLEELQHKLEGKATKHEKKIADVCETYRESARNLLHYQAFREYDLRSVQKQLRNLSLSRLANAEGHLMASLHNTLHILRMLNSEDTSARPKAALSIKKAHGLLTKHTKELLGYRSKGRRVRIMVTQPTESAYNYELVDQMVRDGMNCARVNCAHDTPEVWLRIIENVRKAAKARGRKVKIAMDLAGPKIRTGAIKPGPKVRKCRPERGDIGNIIRPAVVWLVDKVTEEMPPQTFPVAAEVLETLEVGDELSLVEARDKHRRLKVIEKEFNRIKLHVYKTCYLMTDMVVHTTHKTCRNLLWEKCRH